MAYIRVNGKRVRVAGTCYNHACKALTGHTLCQVCLDRLKERNKKRVVPIKNSRCIRCERRKKRNTWKGRMCSYCRRTLRRNPDAEIRKLHS